MSAEEVFWACPPSVCILFQTHWNVPFNRLEERLLRKTQPALVLVLAGRSHSGQAEQLKPDSLLRLTLGGLTLTLLQEDPPPRPDGASSVAQVSQVFFRELAFFKDSMFSERDFQHLRGGFAKACPHSHLR